MNTLQLTPVGAKTAPAVTTGGPSPVGEALSSPQNSDFQAHAAQQRQLAEARANTARAAAERKAQAERTAEAAARTATVKANLNILDRKVGLVDGTFDVFVDLVEPIDKRPLVRVFGPPDNPVPPPPQPRTSVAASEAYARGGVPSLPPKSLTVT